MKNMNTTIQNSTTTTTNNNNNKITSRRRRQCSSSTKWFSNSTETSIIILLCIMTIIIIEIQNQSLQCKGTYYCSIRSGTFFVNANSNHQPPPPPPPPIMNMMHDSNDDDNNKVPTTNNYNNNNSRRYPSSFNDYDNDYSNKDDNYDNENDEMLYNEQRRYNNNGRRYTDTNNSRYDDDDMDNTSNDMNRRRRNYDYDTIDERQRPSSSPRRPLREQQKQERSRNDFPQRQQRQYQRNDQQRYEYDNENDYRRTSSRTNNNNNNNNNNINSSNKYRNRMEEEYDNDENDVDEGLSYQKRRQGRSSSSSSSSSNSIVDQDETKKSKSFFSFSRTKKSNGSRGNDRRKDSRPDGLNVGGLFNDKNNNIINNNNRDNRDNKNDEKEEGKEYIPINYQFPSQKNPNSFKDNYNNQDTPSSSSRRQNPNYSNARKDAIARYTSSKSGKIKLALSSTTCGACFGAFIGKSILGSGKQLAILFGFIFWFIGSFLRDAYGEMVRAVGLGFIYLLHRTRYVRKTYKTGRHLKAICRIAGGSNSRVPFPPIATNDNGDDDNIIENPWKYKPQSDSDPDFDMIKSMICIVIVGSFCGGNIPLLPTWIGSTAGAGTFAFMAIGKNSRGDLLRTMGMRVVATAGEAIDINEELDVARKVSVVIGKLLDKALILDRKHRIKDKLLKSATWVYDRVSSTVSSVREDMNEDGSNDGENQRDRRGFQRRPR